MINHFLRGAVMNNMIKIIVAGVVVSGFYGELVWAAEPSKDMGQIVSTAPVFMIEALKCDKDRYAAMKDSYHKRHDMITSKYTELAKTRKQIEADFDRVLKMVRTEVKKEQELVARSVEKHTRAIRAITGSRS
jgi:hypothetical protein